MKFPEFVVRTYEFPIFKGNEVVKAQQGTIPERVKSFNFFAL